MKTKHILGGNIQSSNYLTNAETIKRPKDSYKMRTFGHREAVMWRHRQKLEGCV